MSWIDEQYKDEVCSCGENCYEISIYHGGGGSGTYIKMKCKKCNRVYELDFENPNYEG